MATTQKSLSDHHTDAVPHAAPFSFGIAWSRWNEEITSALRQGAIDTLKAYGAEEANIHLMEVPGAFELPMAARLLCQKHKLDAVICLGCVIKGETAHNEYINQAVAQGLIQLSLMSGVPAIFGVLTPNDQQQALDRAGGQHGNKGVEAAVTAIHMAALRQAAKTPDGHRIGF
jgi:6,7-dimethyl-8-ribityllumazine synthase